MGFLITLITNLLYVLLGVVIATAWPEYTSNLVKKLKSYFVGLFKNEKPSGK